MTDVVVLRALGLGDLLTAVPALRGLRRAWPGARLRLAAPAEVGTWLASLGVVDDVIDTRSLEDAVRLASRPVSPEFAVDLHGRGPRSHELLSGLGARRLVAYACAVAGHDDGPLWREDEHEVDRWVRLARWVGGWAEARDLYLPGPSPVAKHVVIHPGASAPARRWPVERWAAVASALGRRGRPVVVTGSHAERDLCRAVAVASPRAVDLSGRLDLAGLHRVVGTAALLLSGDTGVAHLATAARTRSVTLFGPVSPALWGPRVDADLHRVLWSVAAGGHSASRPGDAHGAVLDERLARITVHQVLHASASLLDPGARRSRPPRATRHVPASGPG